MSHRAPTTHITIIITFLLLISSLDNQTHTRTGHFTLPTPSKTLGNPSPISNRSIAFGIRVRWNKFSSCVHAFSCSKCRGFVTFPVTVCASMAITFPTLVSTGYLDIRYELQLHRSVTESHKNKRTILILVAFFGKFRFTW